MILSPVAGELLLPLAVGELSLSLVVWVATLILMATITLVAQLSHIYKQ